MSSFWDSAEDDGASDLEAFDEYLPSDSTVHSDGLDVFGDYVPVHDGDVEGLSPFDETVARDAGDGNKPATTEDSDRGMPDMRFSASDPWQIVTVTALLNGMIDHVELSPQTGREMTERELATEIIAVAEVAAAKAQSAQYELVYELMRLQGQDRDSIRSVVEGMLHLPTPEQAIASEAEFTSQRTFGQS
ncbi:hypothetical protein [Mycobacterium sp. DL440]|uniref:hypothetical protein n=1 Tax=Mycobacterium sp. DL440 TaxID=2675523 RepID=UPI00141E7A0C|nr:hypothetical protein [Mycobacterium sp. DL440]